MYTITATELKENIDEYIELGQEEEIVVMHHGKIIFFIIPKKVRLKKEWISFFGSLPKEALDDDINRE